MTRLIAGLTLLLAAAFALSAVGFRGAVIAVPGVSFVTAASYTLVLGLFVQTLVLTIYLLVRAPDVLKKMYVLRRILNPMGTMDAIDFLLDKLRNTKSNNEFFDSMNT